MAIPELVKRLVEVKLGKYCDNKFPDHVSDQIRLSFKFHGNTVFLIESRPAIIGSEWTDLKISKFKYDPENGKWELFCADRNERWHSYFETDREKDFQILINAVEEDVTGIFWG